LLLVVPARQLVPAARLFLAGLVRPVDPAGPVAQVVQLDLVPRARRCNSRARAWPRRAECSTALALVPPSTTQKTAPSEQSRSSERRGAARACSGRIESQDSQEPANGRV